MTLEEQLLDLIIYWKGKQGTYTRTSAGTIDKTYTDINENRARSNVAYYEKLLELVQRGATLRAETIARIKRTHRRLRLTFG